MIVRGIALGVGYAVEEFVEVLLEGLFGEEGWKAVIPRAIIAFVTTALLIAHSSRSQAAARARAGTARLSRDTTTLSFSSNPLRAGSDDDDDDDDDDDNDDNDDNDDDDDDDDDGDDDDGDDGDGDDEGNGDRAPEAMVPPLPAQTGDQTEAPAPPAATSHEAASHPSEAPIPPEHVPEQGLSEALGD